MQAFDYKRSIVDVCHKLDEKGFVGTFEGNVSYRDKDKIYITPTKTSKALLTEQQIITINENGEVIEGNLKPTSETIMHTSCYKKRSDINAIVHCHSPYSTAFAQTGSDIVLRNSPEFMIFFGKVPCLSYGTPGTDRIISDIDEFINDYDVFLLESHGVLALGKDPMDAFSKVVSLEMILNTEYIRLNMFGDINCDLDDEECDKLLAFGKNNRGYHL